jgi:copper homeostasis protein
VVNVFLGNTQMLVEAYVETPEQAIVAVGEGADRLELCGPGEGGLTPSDDLLRAVKRAVSVPVHVMVRPRPGDFFFSAAEFAEIRRDVPRMRELGASGVVLAVLRSDSRLHLEWMAELVELAKGMRVVCHRAFDATPDADAALDQMIALGVHEILTSGHAATAFEGAATLRRHVERAAGRIGILAGGGVRAHNARELVAQTGVQSLHARAFDPGVIRGIRAAISA